MKWNGSGAKTPEPVARLCWRRSTTTAGASRSFAVTRTFLDAKSVNHAVLSFQTMRDGRFLREESARVRGLAQCAVLLHNRYALSPMLDPAARFVTDIVRDSDKLDIFRVMVSYLGNALRNGTPCFFTWRTIPDRGRPRWRKT